MLDSGLQKKRAWFAPALLPVTAILLFAACSGSPSGGSTGSASASHSASESPSGPALRLVVLGDSIAEADAVLVTIGLNDLAFGRIDDPCKVASDFPRIRWSAITHACVDETTDEYRRDLNAVLAEIDELRAGKPTMLRVTTVYNSVIGDLVDPTWNSPAAIEPSMYAVERMAEAQCEVSKAHDGLCADTHHALNGEDGSESAQPFLNPEDATHLAQAGEDAFAAALIALGFSPLQR